MSLGRLIHVKDGSGATALSYGSMGEVVRTVRRIVVNPDPEHLQTHTFVSESEYDSWGRILSMTYLDGEVVKYGYHSGTGELASVKSGDNTYSYDKADNITQIYGSSNKYEQNYEYDEFNRLIRATGRCSCVFNGGKNCSYDVSYKYNIMSGFDKVSKNIQKYDENKNEFVSIEGKNAYLYGDIQPGAPVKVGDAEYKYDASGNPVSMRGGDSDRTLKYDAENRLRVIEDTHNGTMSLYTYNHTGERSLKRYGAFNAAYLNGAYAGSGLDGLTRYSAYISPYYVEHGTGTNASNATKHYYIGTERLVSKLVTSVNKKDDVKEEENTYYYFTDHLGSTTHITDKGGKVVQYAAYTPYGTLFREYKSVMPYKFNGKELDQETGYYYYGARYYDPSAALWLGVDPLAEKYPDVSPYVYCMGNPVLLIDEDGCESRSFDDKVGDVLRDVTGMHSEIQEAKSVQPLAEGAALLNPVIGIANDVKTLATGADIYGNEASSLDKVIAVVDIASFGITKAAGAEKVVSAIGSACASKIEKVATIVNKITTYGSAIKTTYQGYNEKAK